ncbi:homeobox-leucine zipper HAT5 [Olea europaea subsp. europaea]|uniref:Homeobox-leucine zipper protein n=1 Tax=Olea europaea subsp. europaea TaxID=158383 RepID=A0A8S0QU11_OLEEU|nr:homeobox-leucine zipper HAT5 [Olea europaea subsp. europaea]
MESGGMVFDSFKLTSLSLKNEKLPSSSDVLDSLWIAGSSPSFHGSTSIVNFEDIRGENSTDGPFFDKEENGSEDCDGCFRQPEKKRRLSPDQVQFLEKSFEVENKLEPERKIQLAKEIGLQPRQVAIWYQNRRARYKTKQLEKDYNSLKETYDKLKADHDSLFKENEELRNEVHSLKEKLQEREKGKPKSEPCDTTSPLEAGSEPNKPLPSSVSPNASNIPMVIYKQDDATSAKSDVFDSDSPHYADGIHSSFIEPSDSSHIFGSDFSQDEEDNLSRNLMPPPSFVKLEDDESYGDLQMNSCNLGFPVEDQTTWLWPLIE